MAGYNLPETITGGTGHLNAHGSAHDIVNKFDKDDSPSDGQLLAWDGGTSLYRPSSAIDARLDVLEFPLLNTQTGTSYTVVSGDIGKIVEMNNASSNTITFGSQSTGTIIGIRQYGAGTTTVAASGITIRSRGGLVNLAGQYAEATITYRSATEAVLSGDLV